MDVKPTQHLQVEVFQLSASDGFPNNPQLPLLVYRQALAGVEPDSAEEVEQLLESHGWRGPWRGGVFSFHHFHSNAHEVLGVCGGGARIQFGGPGGPVVSIEAGDVAILPAGTGHCSLEASSDFLVVGGYPAGQESYDLLRGDPAEQAAAEKRIAAVPLPETDPVYESDGPLAEHWKKR